MTGHRGVWFLLCFALLCLIPACGGGGSTTGPPPPAPDFSISVSPLFSSTSVSLAPGATSAPVTVAIAGSNGFSSAVSVSLSGLPAGASTSPASPLTIAANSSQSFTVTCSAGTSTGDSTITLHATSGSLAHDATITLSVNPPVQTSQSGTVLYLESYSSNHTARVGLETAWGGSVVEVSLDGANFVNAHDTGREVQPSLYDGAAQYDSCAGCTGVFGWNPVMGGDKYGHGSPVLAQQAASDSLYVKAQPLQWNPDDKGGGSTTPVPSDAYFEETVTAVAGAPLAFDVHFKLTHFGSDQHYDAWQEFPAVYVNSAYSTLVYYGGTAPWTNDAVSQTSIPQWPGTPLLYAPEQWAANVDGSDSGLTVFVPAQYPYQLGIWFPGGGGSGPTDDATYYLHPFAAATVGPGAVIEGDVYLIAGDSASAREAVYGLHQTLPAADIFSPTGNLDTPAANTTISGNSVSVSGWAIDDTAVSTVSIYVDNVLAGNAVYGASRPDVSNAYPHAPTNCGFTFSLDSTQFTNGTHSITVHAIDSANNEAILAPVTVAVSN